MLLSIVLMPLLQLTIEYLEFRQIGDVSWCAVGQLRLLDTIFHDRLTRGSELFDDERENGTDVQFFDGLLQFGIEKVLLLTVALRFDVLFNTVEHLFLQLTHLLLFRLKLLDVCFEKRHRLWGRAEVCSSVGRVECPTEES